MKFFIDSNIIIESLKEDGLKEAYEILNTLIHFRVIPFINFIVLNETIFILCYKRKLLNLKEVLNFLSNFIKLSLNESIEQMAINYMETYNLKPNDALVLATCKHYNIPYLLSLDEDFKEACEKESLTLIDSVEKLKRVLNKTK